MTKKYYVIIALILREQKEKMSDEAFSDLVDAFIVELKKDNQLFDKERFIKACYEKV